MKYCVSAFTKNKEVCSLKTTGFAQVIVKAQESYLAITVIRVSLSKL